LKSKQAPGKTLSRAHSSPKIDDIAAWVEDSQDGAHNPSREEDPCPARESREKSFHTAPPVPENHSSNLFLSDDDVLYMSPKTVKKNLWSIVWSDLMMTMFIYFALMYIFTTSKAQSSSAAAEPAASSFKHGTSLITMKSRNVLSESLPSIPDFYALSKKTIKTKELSQLASVDLIPDKAVRIVLTGDLLFDLGKAKLKKDAREKLRALAPLIIKSPYLVNVVGHTDDLPIHSPSFSTNWELSVIRACVVARFFIEEMGIPENKFYLSGQSSLQPIKPNISEDNRAANRRVELIITKDRPFGIQFTDEFMTEDLP